jgi:hypothetical protein
MKTTKHTHYPPQKAHAHTHTCSDNIAHDTPHSPMSIGICAFLGGASQNEDAGSGHAIPDSRRRWLDEWDVK